MRPEIAFFIYVTGFVVIWSARNWIVDLLEEDVLRHGGIEQQLMTSAERRAVITAVIAVIAVLWPMFWCIKLAMYLQGAKR